MLPPIQQERIDKRFQKIKSLLDDCELELSKFKRGVKNFSATRKLKYKLSDFIFNNCGECEMF